MENTETSLLLDDFRNPARSSIGTRWRYFSDRVMGGISDGFAGYAEVDGRPALRLQGTVKLDNNGGFIQAALDLGSGGGSFDASAFRGIAFALRGDGREYGIHLRTSDIRRPWQSYRAQVRSGERWTRHELPFAAFRPHRLDRPLDPRRLRRLALVAIEEPGEADVAISDLRLFGRAISV